MVAFRFSLPLLLAVILLAGGCASRKTAPATHGSIALLHALWFDEQLAGADSDLARATLPEPDLRPPLRTTPVRALPPITPERRQVITCVTPRDGRKVVALTFDLCERAPHLAGYQKDIVNFLRSQGVKATFFAGGKWMRSHPDKTLQLMADPLFELGNHAWTHGNLALMDEDEVRQQMDWTQAQYELLYESLKARAQERGLGHAMNTVPQSLRLMRLPYGRNNARTGDLLASMGLPMIQWSVEGEQDELERTVDQLVEWNLGKVRPGAIILMHANAVPQKTHLLVPRLVPELRKRGYEFVTVSELLEMGPAVTVTDGYFDKPGDNLYVDDLFGGKGTLGRVR
ncbi:MAG: polysaccharide deacetylase family protein [Pseudodesulfovibrio sp.]|uniref:Polysaccharide deacetylase n=1 Tax=Pseudodesulfovibrio aespoeensis (strain ATCC 700646 / DSM 10631 / Aspo-2) TaxID=643562 RepID=E6VXD9_PSEA9|nr:MULTISPECIES: polysaccharide deacetylase family protein [Pseudodesulfovibrio]MBU4191477.1 polysaccharide deacetylase family protein [Pseudomonadota bacterium]ADU63755.1 polysaccharide deacetylase [Pseudodesulfovibrio aespoeensis Aspo-2]MBU4244905.1 polysaccharide deacetylase family protein [Pseudomonadota bacterium]MBU4379691.1 polysaccharide deacetylase family protein [Pseudomonadota bacterium]MBU4475671.1 polysaccharide deacetylase family protein [Pseudomonadota bacterium]